VKQRSTHRLEENAHICPGVNHFLLLAGEDAKPLADGSHSPRTSNDQVDRY
jgi:hypothetical protein